MNELHLPTARPMLDVMLALDGVSDVIELLTIDQHLEAISLGKAFGRSLAMLKRSPGNIVRDADIKSAVASIRHDVNEAGHNAHLIGRGWPEQDCHGHARRGLLRLARSVERRRRGWPDQVRP